MGCLLSGRSSRIAPTPVKKSHVAIPSSSMSQLNAPRARISFQSGYSGSTPTSTQSLSLRSVPSEDNQSLPSLLLSYESIQVFFHFWTDQCTFHKVRFCPFSSVSHTNTNTNTNQQQSTSSDFMIFTALLQQVQHSPLF